MEYERIFLHFPFSIIHFSFSHYLSRGLSTAFAAFGVKVR